MSKEAGRLQSRISAMALVGCWALLLLTTNPLPALAGRHDPSTAQENNKMIKHKVISHQLQQQNQELPASSTSLAAAAVGERRPRGATYAHMRSRLLVGSSPPTCRGSCGLCQPCTPVHVVIGIPHVAMTEQEYYPEVWRCQCGNMLYMP
ncbi:unnamed protein product [Sphagnum jensenii]|uniref:Epidermal patterning factor-like protein n=1 Tax=Sphagnum jensenii TaxID=128206 RepID=A0ABP0VPK5_9BRYO